MNNLCLRAISGAVYVALIVCTCLFSSIAFGILMLIFGVIGIYEFDNILRKRDENDSSMGYNIIIDISIIFVLLLSAVFLPNIWRYGILLSPFLILIWIFPILIGIRACVTLFQTSGYPIKSLAISVLGLFYLSFGLLSAICLNFLDKGLTLLVFIFIWLNDTGAYLFGSKFGKRKLCERLSPKKSWEGFWGGMFVCVLAGCIFCLTGFAQYISESDNYFSVVSVSFILPISVALSSTAGDLFESLIKRTEGVKDSGNIIPGHGGILDRIDSMLFTMPFVLFIILLLSAFFHNLGW